MVEKRGIGRAAVVVPAGPNLVTSWRKIVTDNGGKSLVHGLREMNNALGTNVKHYRITQWEQGLNGRQPGNTIINYMLDIVLPHLLTNAGLGKATARNITNNVKILDVVATNNKETSD